jgi:2-polyprenyl-3-methyl-5-hydroxy-6-metoxy-1,4-benzoquinol methylase
MNDNDLFEHYLKRLAPDGSAEWNLSPECLYAQFCMGEAFKSHFSPFRGVKVINVGIGAGEWDDFLGYWAKGFGSVTSVDIDRTICDLLRYRQQREGHPNPSAVVCEDFLSTKLDYCFFDIVTAVGSTLDEVGKPCEMLERCRDLLKPGGRLFLMLFDRKGATEAFFQCLSSSCCRIVHDIPCSHYPALPFRIFVVERGTTAEEDAC